MVRYIGNGFQVFHDRRTEFESPGGSGRLAKQEMHTLVLSRDQVECDRLAFLLEHQGNAALQAYTVEQAWAQIKAHQINIVVLDMPQATSEFFVFFQVCRSAQDTHAIPFLFVAGQDFKVPVLPLSGNGSKIKDSWLVRPLKDRMFQVTSTRLLQQRALDLLRETREAETRKTAEIDLKAQDDVVDRTTRMFSREEILDSLDEDIEEIEFEHNPKSQTSDTGFLNGSVLSGQIAVLNVTKLLEIIGQMALTGRLYITDEKRKGFIHFVSGALWHAELMGIEGPDALFLIFHMDEGQFYFEYCGEPERRTIEGNTMSLLLEGLRQMDETKRAIQAHQRVKEEMESGRFAAQGMQTAESRFIPPPPRF
jgi:DNA-binding response OmpR family regulator